MRRLVLAASVAALAACASSGTNTTETAAAITADHAVPLLNWTETEKVMASGGVLVDSRGPAAYAEGHIAGAINVPCRTTEAYSALPDDKNTALVFYCGGPACRASNKGALTALGMGYQNVSEYKGGFPEWQSLKAPSTRRTEQIASQIPHLAWDGVASAVSGGAVLVDARGEETYAEGHIEGAVNVPWRDGTAYSRLPEDKTTKLIFYCGGPSCAASTKGAMAAMDLGYLNVAEYKGGYPEWSARK